MTTTRNELAERIQNELVAYLKAGQPINQDQVAMALDSSGLGISDLDRLLRIRFALSEPVQAYLDPLHDRLSRIRTETAIERQDTRGEIRGSIDWGQTIRTRYAENPNDRSRFVTRTSNTEYQLPENILVKSLLAQIAQTARRELLDIDQQWRREIWDDGSIQRFLRQYDRNVHLDRIEADADTELSPRAKDKARQARQPLYYEAYDLYRLYERLLAREFEESDAAQLLFETLIVPETATLFELAAVFELLTVLQEQQDVSLYSIERRSDAIATVVDSEWEYRVYHDSTGRLKFHEPVPETGGLFIERSRQALERHATMMQRGGLRPLYSGRPDIVVEVYPRGVSEAPPVHVILGEVKHTESKATLSDGVYELLRYLEFARPDPSAPVKWESEEYLSDHSGVTLSGVVITDGVAFTPRTGELPITHARLGSLESKYEDLLSSVDNREF